MTAAGGAAPRFEALLAQFEATLRALLARHCRGNAGLDADEIAQDVRVRIWRAVEDGRIGDLHASYLQKLVVSAVIDAARRRKAHDADRLDDVPEAEPALLTAADPARVAADGALVATVARCVQALPPRRRLPVALHLQGFGFPEIGELLAVSAESARKLVTRGMDELRERLKAAGVDEHGAD